MKCTDADSRPRVLFLSRAFPPVVGGLERQNGELSRALGRILPTTVLANRRGKRFLPLFLASSLARVLILSPQVDLILLGDAVLAPLGVLLRRLTGKPVVGIAHGLDVTYPLPLYQGLWLGRRLGALEAVIAVSRQTARECMQRGVDPKRIFVIPNGVPVPARADAPRSARLEWLSEEKRKGRKILLTVGRLRKRKGIAWFTEAVLPRLPSACLYVVAGEGPESQEIEKAALRHRLTNRLRLAGRVTEEEKSFLFSQADVFVQPNIPVPGDMEGFGIGVLEAAASGVPVVAADLEGLRDAIHEGKNGFRVPPLNAWEFALRITHLLEDDTFRCRAGEIARSYTCKRFQWDRIARRYASVLSRVYSTAGTGT